MCNVWLPLFIIIRSAKPYKNFPTCQITYDAYLAINRVWIVARTIDIQHFV